MEQENLDWLKSESYIMREEGIRDTKGAEKQLKRYGIDVDQLTVVASMESQEAIKRSVMNGMGISIISRLAAEEEVRTGKVLCRKVPGEGEGRDLNVVYNKNFHFQNPLSGLLK